MLFLKSFRFTSSRRRCYTFGISSPVNQKNAVALSKQLQYKTKEMFIILVIIEIVDFSIFNWTWRVNKLFIPVPTSFPNTKRFEILQNAGNEEYKKKLFIIGIPHHYVSISDRTYNSILDLQSPSMLQSISKLRLLQLLIGIKQENQIKGMRRSHAWHAEFYALRTTHILYAPWRLQKWICFSFYDTIIIYSTIRSQGCVDFSFGQAFGDTLVFAILCSECSWRS